MKKELNNFFKDLATKLTETNKEQTLKTIKEKIESQGYSNRSLTINYSLIKKIFKDYTTDQTFLSKIKPDDEITKSVIKENQEVKETRPMKPVNKDIIETLKTYKKSDKLHPLLTWLLFVSGRRISEILEGTFFTKPRNKNLFFKGIKKKKTDDDETYELKLISTKTAFLKNYKKMLKLKGNRSNETVIRQNSRFIKKNLGEDFNNHSLRGIYANYLFKFNNPDELRFNTFIKNVLKHDIVETSLNYSGYNIKQNKKIRGL